MASKAVEASLRTPRSSNVQLPLPTRRDLGCYAEESVSGGESHQTLLCPISFQRGQIHCET